MSMTNFTLGSEIVKEPKHLSGAAQTTVTLDAIADAPLRRAWPDTNFGDEDTLEIAYDDNTGHWAVTMLRFDLSSLPSDAVIDTADLRLFLNDASGASSVSIVAHYVTSSWDEATVTWNNSPSTGTSGVAASIDDATGSYKSWEVSSFAQSWIDDPSSNHGVLLIGPEGGYYERWFASRESPGNSPRLEVTYHVPPYTFSGHVYAGEPEDTATPLQGVAVELWGDEDEWPEGGFERVPLATATTDESGAFELTWEPDGDWPYFHVMEVDPPGATSTGAEAGPGGSVKNFNVVSYLDSPVGSYPDIAFWDEGASTLFADDFEDGNPDGWRLEEGWNVVEEEGEFVLHGSGHHWATPNVEGGKDYELTTRLKLHGGTVHVNLRLSQELVNDTDWVQKRYLVGMFENRVYVKKQVGGHYSDLFAETIPFSLGDWHTVRIRTVGATIEVYLDGALVARVVDGDSPVLSGGFALETLALSEVSIADIGVLGPVLEPSLDDYVWYRTGGPSGGLGYDVRIHPTDPISMFVTDNPSGVNKSYDGGETWMQRNEGIDARLGTTADEIPIFSLTIDPSHPNIVWAGTQNFKGVYKSVDGGESWVKKTDGITEGNEISFRNFGIHPTISNTVFGGAEIRTSEMGQAFNRTKGKIYKTTDGGDHWYPVWSGGSLVRFILFNHQNPQIMYASTGIFDREAWDDQEQQPGGVGILKSTDGGEHWHEINNGIPQSDGNRFLGFLEMHPTNPQILFAAAGNNTWGKGGVFRTTNGGASWEKVLGDDIFTMVVISPSDPDVVYAGSAAAIYRSDEGGDPDTWQRFWKGPEEHAWGPPGIVAGVPIGAVVDPSDPMTIFVNNYGGGNFKSTDGGGTWVNASAGYTGAKLMDVVVSPDSEAVVYAIGRPGPFRSHNGGADWTGLAYAPASFPEWYAVAVHPENPQEVLISDEHQGVILKSTDGGKNWHVGFDFDHSSVNGGCTDGPKYCHDGFRVIAHAPSSPTIIYAGMCAERRTIEGPFEVKRPSYGMYKSTLGGEPRTWHEINDGLPASEGAMLNILAIAVDPFEPDVVYIGTWKNGVYKTVDGGDNWMPMNNGLTATEVRSLAIDPNYPEVVYAGLGEGRGIAKSVTAGALWQEINNGINLECPSYLLPIGGGVEGVSLERAPEDLLTRPYYSIPWTSIWDIAIDPTDSSTIYAADNQSGVYLSTDAGESWDPINKGLTMKAVTGLDISADGEVVYAATWGGGVFRLGEVELYAVYLPLVTRDVH